ncbi:MAG: restriction endonuclease subunit S [Bifidobacteriaceae bacterium]|nr:restriction endonuclease subunit S [Bifidobacteriaceae bacterium]
MIGTRVTSSQNSKNGLYPVYSANVFTPAWHINELNPKIANFNRPSIIWSIDSDWQVNYIASNIPFYPTDHCGVLRIKSNQIIPRIIVEQIYKLGKEKQFSRSYRASIEKISSLVVKVPNVATQKHTVKIIEEIDKQIYKLKNKLVKIKQEQSTIIEKYL